MGHRDWTMSEKSSRRIKPSRKPCRLHAEFEVYPRIIAGFYDSDVGLSCSCVREDVHRAQECQVSFPATLLLN